jgi:hypothetical protein
LPRRTTVPEKMVEYLKNIYPRPATLKELCSVIGISACVGSSWIKTLISTREIEVYGKDGRRNLYRYRPK